MIRFLRSLMGLLFLASGVAHLILNWDALLDHLRKKNGEMVIFTPPFFLGLAVSLLVFVASLAHDRVDVGRPPGGIHGPDALVGGFHEPAIAGFALGQGPLGLLAGGNVPDDPDHVAPAGGIGIQRLAGHEGPVAPLGVEGGLLDNVLGSAGLDHGDAKRLVGKRRQNGPGGLGILFLVLGDGNLVVEEGVHPAGGHVLGTGGLVGIAVDGGLGEPLGGHEVGGGAGLDGDDLAGGVEAVHVRDVGGLFEA